MVEWLTWEAFSSYRQLRTVQSTSSFICTLIYKSQLITRPRPTLAPGTMTAAAFLVDLGRTVLMRSKNRRHRAGRAVRVCRGRNIRRVEVARAAVVLLIMGPERLVVQLPKTVGVTPATYGVEEKGCHCPRSVLFSTTLTLHPLRVRHASHE